MSNNDRIRSLEDDLQEPDEKGGLDVVIVEVQKHVDVQSGEVSETKIIVPPDQLEEVASFDDAQIGRVRVLQPRR